VGVCMLCGCDSEDREDGLTESVSREFRLKKKHEPVYCSYDSEENEHGVGTGVNATILSETL
jgi:hypothetical protein